MDSFGILDDLDDWMVKMDDEILERNKNLNRGFRKLKVWREAIDLYVFEKKVLRSNGGRW